MLRLSTIPLLCTALAFFWIWLANRARTEGRINFSQQVAIALWTATLAAWGCASAYLSVSGYYQSAGFLALVPGLWWPMIPMMATAAFFLWPTFRRGILGAVRLHPRAMVAVQGLRALAVGGVVKGLTGLLPPSFALPIGIPDAIFGLSAMALAMQWPRDGFSPRTLLLWNLAGMAVILPAPILMQLGLPGYFHVFSTAPDARALFEYPMVLAPTLIVPLFLIMNAIHCAALWVRWKNPNQDRASDLRNDNAAARVQ